MSEIPEDIVKVSRNIVTDICVKRGQMLGFHDQENEYLEQKIARAILAERERHGWQPIETVPKDGTIVDLWHRDGFRVCDEWWDEEDGWTGGWLEGQFTHWIKATVTQP